MDQLQRIEHENRVHIQFFLLHLDKNDTNIIDITHHSNHSRKLFYFKSGRWIILFVLSSVVCMTFTLELKTELFGICFVFFFLGFHLVGKHQLDSQSPFSLNLCRVFVHFTAFSQLDVSQLVLICCLLQRLNLLQMVFEFYVKNQLRMVRNWRICLLEWFLMSQI